MSRAEEIAAGLMFDGNNKVAKTLLNMMINMVNVALNPVLLYLHVFVL